MRANPDEPIYDYFKSGNFTKHPPEQMPEKAQKKLKKAQKSLTKVCLRLSKFA